MSLDANVQNSHPPRVQRTHIQPSPPVDTTQVNTMGNLKAFLREYVGDRHCFDVYMEDHITADKDVDEQPAHMKRCLNLFDLFMMGVAAIVGASYSKATL